MPNAIELYAREKSGFAERLAQTIVLLREAAAQHPGRIVQASSLGAEDMVITDLIAREQVDIAVATLETGKLHAQTLALVRRTEQHTGLRREQSGTRAAVALREVDEHGRTKLSPLADWSWNDVWHYIASRQVPYNPLHDDFMPSIGCEPCTRAIAVGEDFRSGRWWWEEETAKECGLHVRPHSADPPSSALSRSESSGFVSAQADIGRADVKGVSAPGRGQDDSTQRLHKQGTPA